jgi:hypothetical protein
MRFSIRFGVCFLALAIGVTSLSAQEGMLGKIDLATTTGVEAIKGEWRYSPVMTGTGKEGNEIEPKAHGVFDDSKWEVLKPETLKKGLGDGKYSWCWYRLKVTIPEKIGDKAFEGGPVWFQTTVDDYGEIWVDGEIDRAFGKSGRGAVSGFNTRNRVRLQKREPSTTEKDPKTPKAKTVLRDAKPGDVFQIAVLGINSPLGNPPANKIFMHKAINLEFFAKDAKDGGADVPDVAGPPTGKLTAAINLMTKDGVNAVKGEWRYAQVKFHTGEGKNEIEPKAHGKFDDSKWDKFEDPAALAKAFGPAKFSMYWVRTTVTIPEKVGDIATEGKSVWFRTTVDDYGEVWVDGKIDLSYGKSGRGAISGFNTPNEVKLTDKAKSGQTFQIAVLAINSPFGNPPGNKIFFRSPTELRFYEPKDEK